jgi:hypothetical protein
MSDSNRHESAATSDPSHCHIIHLQGFVTFYRSLMMKNYHHKLVTIEESSQSL